jgi:hypothetical protein
MVMLVAASGISVVAVVVQSAAEDRYDFQKTISTNQVEYKKQKKSIKS